MYSCPCGTHKNSIFENNKIHPLLPLQGLTGVDMTDDSSLIAGGFADSTVRVWSVTPKKLRKVKSAAGTTTRRWLKRAALSADFQGRNSNILPSSAWRLKPDWQGVWGRAGEDHGWEDIEWVKDSPRTQWASVWHQFQSRQVEILFFYAPTHCCFITDGKYVDIHWMDS